MTLAEFLLARVTEDEGIARDAGDGGPVTHGRRSELETVWDRDYGQVAGAVAIDSARLIAECEAKRQIVEIAVAQIRLGREAAGWDNWESMANQMLQAVALPYADHPDYREEWRP